MNEINLKQIIENMPLGYALHEFIKDEKDSPCNYIFVEINSAFEEYTGLKAKEIIGKKVTQVHPNIKEDQFDWIKAYSEVAFRGKSLEFEQKFQATNKWYRIYAYQPKSGYFVTLVEEITDKKKLENQKILLETELSRLGVLLDVYKDKYLDEQRFLDDILHRALDITNSEYGYIYLYNEEIEQFNLNSWTNTVMDDCKVMDKQTVYELDKTGLWGEVVRQRKSIVVNDFEAPNQFKKGYPEGHVKLLNFMSIPIFEDGEIIAVVGVANKESAYTGLDVQQLTLLMQSGWAIKKQKELGQELERFKAIADNAVYGKAMADLDGKLIYVNNFFAKIHGYNSEELIGESISIFHSELQKEKVELLLEEIQNNGYFDMQEVWHVHKNGKEFPMLMSGLLLKDIQGNPECLAASAVDITDKKILEENLEEAYKIANLGRWDYYHKENKLEWSKTIYDIFEVDSDHFEPSYDLFIKAIHPEDRSKVDQAWRNGIANMKPYRIDHRLLMDDGRVKWVHEECRTEYDIEGLPIQSVGTIQDVTDRKEMEHTIFREKEQLKTTLLSLGEGVISTDSKGNILILNPVAEDLTGWQQDDAIGKKIEEVFCIVDEITKKESINLANKVVENKRRLNTIDNIVLVSKDGKEISIEASAAPIKDEKEKMTGVVIIFRDVTDKKKSQEKIKYLSFHDELTGLYNRRFFEEEMKRLDTTRSYPLTLIIADLNGLKLANDAFGHKEGDNLLKKTADIFRFSLRSEDIIARWGGDEFTVLMPNTSSKDTGMIINRIQKEIEQYNKSIDKKAKLSIAIGYETKTDNTMSLESVFKRAEEHMYNQKLRESQSSHGMTIQTIVKSLYEKSPREKRHSERVMELAIETAKALQLSQNKVDDIANLGLLHDIGKIAIPTEILEKKGRLTKQEYKEMEKHPSIGYRMLSTINDFSSIAEGVLSHHERWDGKGYPRGLKEEQIPLEARIIAVVNAYDIMVSENSYKEEIEVIEAIDELEKYSGSRFDPHIVEVFIKDVLLGGYM